MISVRGGCTFDWLLYVVNLSSTDQTRAATEGRLWTPGPEAGVMEATTVTAGPRTWVRDVGTEDHRRRSAELVKLGVLHGAVQTA
jgi:hypothetical protein